MSTLQSKSTRLFKIFLYSITLLSVILTPTTTVVQATSPQNSEQVHQVFLPLVSNEGSQTDVGSNLVQAARSSRLNRPNVGYTNDKVIVIGTPSNIQGCIENRAVSQYVNNTPVNSFGNSNNSSQKSLGAGQEIRVYDVKSPSKNAVNNTLSALRNNCTGVITEPNYTYTFGADPWASGGGSIAMKRAANVNVNSFWNQPALGMYNLESKVSSSGATVGVFDTLPNNVPIGWVNLEAHSDYMSSSLGCGRIATGNTSAIRNIDPIIKEHGLNVASLIKAASPNSSVHLYQVLNDCGKGDIASLMHALHDFVTTTDGTNSPRVINMSLGAPSIPTDIIHLNEQPYSLELLLNSIKDQGVAIVASSGNSSANKEAQDSHWPAAYDSVLGVAASAHSNGQIGRACYSNKGDIAAPGGFTNIFESTKGDTIRLIVLSEIDDYPFSKGCIPNLNYCENSPEQCIIARTGKKQFNYVKGTSFASSIVAGIIARNLAEGSYSDIEHFYDCIKGGAQEVSYASTLGEGIATMNFACPYIPPPTQGPLSDNFGS